MDYLSQLRTSIIAAAVLAATVTVAMAAEPTGGGMNMDMPPPKICTLSDAQKTAMLSASYHNFDEEMSGEGSWRPLVNDGCYEAAAQIVSLYLDKHGSSLTPEQIWTLNFHVGQALAIGGMDEASIPWFKKSRDPHADAEWTAYVDATLAFLAKDKERLTAARAAYLAATKPDAPRLRVIDGFLACLPKPYMEAMMCAPAPAAH